MAGNPTTYIARLLRSIIGENDWATEYRQNLEALSEYFAQTGEATLEELNDGTAAIEGEFIGQPYYNGVATVPFMAICSKTGAAAVGEWKYLANWVMDWAAANASFQWVKGQTTKWIIDTTASGDYEPWITPNPDDADQKNGNYHFLYAIGNVTVIAPKGISGDTSSVLMIAFCQGSETPPSTLDWSTAFAMAGGVTLPVTEIKGEVDLFSCIRAPNGIWMVSPAFKFDVGYEP